MRVLGWDIGGAHVKAALCVHGRLRRVWQLPCPLWRNLRALIDCVAVVAAEAGTVDAHALTMTGELSDVFLTRDEGVASILSIFTGTLPRVKTWVYAHPGRFLTPRQARARIGVVASVNWSVTAAWVATRCTNALVVDIGSTTTDLVPIVRGRLDVHGITDEQRLAQEELVYSGVVRTPVVALVQQLPYQGSWRALMAEVFATSADVYRLTGQLPHGADLMPSADGRGKSRLDSARRLGRMIGVDVTAARQMVGCASHVAQAQLWNLQRVCARVLSATDIPDDAPVVGAGVGRFVAQALATRLRRRYRDIAQYLSANTDVADAVSDVAPAGCIALLAHETLAAQ